MQARQHAAALNHLIMHDGSDYAAEEHKSLTSYQGPGTDYDDDIMGKVERPGNDVESQDCQRLHWHWKVPTMLIGTLLAGVALACGHHFFNAHMNDKVVANTFPPQKWVIRVGTGFAFLIKTLLAMAAGCAFVQLQWKLINGKRVRMDHLDAMTSVSNTPLSLFAIKTWNIYPILFLIALVITLLPLAAVVTPGTITVVSRVINSTAPAKTPQHNWLAHTEVDGTYSQYASVCYTEDSETSVAYSGPMPDVIRTVYASGGTGSILTIPAGFANASYTWNFFGPAVACGSAPQAINDTLLNAQEYLMTAANKSGWGIRHAAPGFIPVEWLALVPTTKTFNLTQYASSAASLDYSLDSSAIKWTTLDQVSQDAARIYIAFPYHDDNDHITQDVIECQLYNASYSVEFDLTSSPIPSQNISFKSIEYTNPVNAVAAGTSIIWTHNPTLLIPEAAQQWAYAGMMDAFSSILVGVQMSTAYAAGFRETQYQLLASLDLTSPKTAMASLEELFQNFTISVLSKQSLILNSTKAIDVSVTSRNSTQVYSYQPKDLVAAYATSAGLTIICTIIGCYALWKNRLCFENKFSTYYRLTRNEPPGGAVILDGDLGADPLPEEVERMAVIPEAKKSITPSAKPASPATTASPAVPQSATLQGHLSVPDRAHAHRHQSSDSNTPFLSAYRSSYRSSASSITLAARPPSFEADTEYRGGASFL